MPQIRGTALRLGLVGGCMYHGLDADQGLYLAKWAGKAMIPELGGRSFGLLDCVSAVMWFRKRPLKWHLWSKG